MFHVRQNLTDSDYESNIYSKEEIFFRVSDLVTFYTRSTYWYKSNNTLMSEYWTEIVGGDVEY